ncbi:MAG: Fe-S protein assembly co-chaperone HscB, partial [Terracidiphilus sp.]
PRGAAGRAILRVGRFDVLFAIIFSRVGRMLKIHDPAVPVACWSCSVGHNDSILFCPHCSKIQPPPGSDFFSVFGLEPRLNLDLKALETEFHRLSRKLHPDRFARAPDNEKQWSLADTALVNDAYRTLRDPVRRTEYLLKLKGVRQDSGHEDEARAPAPPDLLEEVFDLNLQIEEMRTLRAAGGTNPELAAGLVEAKEKFEEMLRAVDERLRAEWLAWDGGDETARLAAQEKMATLLSHRRYLANLLRDVNEILGD